jgi:hypothetical protein
MVFLVEVGPTLLGLQRSCVAVGIRPMQYIESYIFNTRMVLYAALNQMIVFAIGY